MTLILLDMNKKSTNFLEDAKLFKQERQAESPQKIISKYYRLTASLNYTVFYGTDSTNTSIR